MWDAIAQDARHALRALRASPSTSLFVVVTLGLGIGALAAMYETMSSLLLQPPPHVAEPERVKRLFFHRDEPGEPRVTRASWYSCVHDRLRAEAETLQSVGAYSRFDVSVGAGADAARARAVVVSAGFWAAVGTRPALGRLFADEEAGRATPSRLAILGHAFWQRQFGGNADVVGQPLRIRGEVFEVIGVTPRGFRGVERDPVDVWLPLSAYPLSGRSWETDTELSYVVRVKDEVSGEQVDAELSRTLFDVVDEDVGCERRLGAEAPAARLAVTAGPLSGGLGSDMRLVPEARVTVWLFGVALALLGVAAANVAGLLLLRALRRRREIAVRLALGMSVRRLGTQLVLESLMLAALGALAARVVVAWGGAWLNGVLLPNVAWEPAAAAGGPMLALTVTCIVGTAFLAALVTLLQAPADPLRALQNGSSTTTGRRGWAQRSLLVAQTALSVVLLTGAGLFLRSLHNIRALDLGLDPDNVLVATIDFEGSGRPPRDVSAFYERALERIESQPGVERASLAMSVPLRSARAGSIRPAGRADRLSGPAGDATYVNFVTPGFFATVGTRVIEGRDFLSEERDAREVVVVNEALARVGWPGRSPVGDCVEVEGADSCATIVGVVANARRFFLTEPPALLFYRPLSRVAEERARALFVRLAPGSERMEAAVARALQELEPALPFIRVQALGAALDPQIRPWRLGAAVFTAFGGLAFVLAWFGLYGALSYAVGQRTREIGVRVVVGARRSNIVRLVANDGLAIAGAGAFTGLAISLAAGRWLGDLLFNVSPRDPVVLAAAAGSLVMAAVLAALLSARRAARVDPMTALRAE